MSEEHIKEWIKELSTKYKIECREDEALQADMAYETDEDVLYYNIRGILSQYNFLVVYCAEATLEELVKSAFGHEIVHRNQHIELTNAKDEKIRNFWKDTLRLIEEQGVEYLSESPWIYLPFEFHAVKFNPENAAQKIDECDRKLVTSLLYNDPEFYNEQINKMKTNYISMIASRLTKSEFKDYLTDVNYVRICFLRDIYKSITRYDYQFLTKTVIRIRELFENW